MANDPRRSPATEAEPPSIPRTLLGDIQRGDLRSSFRRDLRDLYHFYLDDEHRSRLARVGRVRRALMLSWWLLKALLLKLSPARRLMLFVALALFLSGGITFTSKSASIAVGFDFGPVSLLLLLVVLMLELKDKLLARDELQVGRAVQLALTPPERPAVAGWDIWLHSSPAREVGGDLVDFINLDEGRVAVVVGDVSGKGLGAALLMARLQATLRAFATPGGSLPALGASLNDFFRRSGMTDRFASLVYAELGPHGGEVRLLNAGHLAPVLMGKVRLEELAPTAPALGVLKAAEFGERKLHLEPAETLLLYSDGLTEARSPQGEFFGQKRFRELASRVQGLPAAAAGSTILGDLRSFVGDGQPSDDLTLAILRRLPVAAPARATAPPRLE